MRAQVDGRLGDLMRKQFVVREELDLYRFEHILIREAVYDALLKRARASLHERYVAWADRVNGDRAAEFDEILGYHLEQAHRYLVELGPAASTRSGSRATARRRLSSAGRRAFERGDMPAASRLLLRATALLPPLDPARLRLFPDLGEALLQVGEVARAESLLDDAIAAAELAERARDRGHDRRRPHARPAAHRLRRGAGPSRRCRLRRPPSPRPSRPGDDAAAARAWRLVASIRGNACRHEEGVEAIEAALRHARRAGDARQERRSATVYALAARLRPDAGPGGDRPVRGAGAARRGRPAGGGGAPLRPRPPARARRRARRRARPDADVEGAVRGARAARRRGGAVDPGGARGVPRGRPGRRRGRAQARLRGARRARRPLLAGVDRGPARAGGVPAGSVRRGARARRPSPRRAPASTTSTRRRSGGARARRCSRTSGDVEAGERLAREAVELLRPTDAVLFEVAALADLAEVLAAAGGPTRRPRGARGARARGGEAGAAADGAPTGGRGCRSPPRRERIASRTRCARRRSRAAACA